MTSKYTQYKAVYDLVRRIPSGRVLTYGYIARLTGINNARLVGHILHQNPEPSTIPCHRVVSSQGKIADNFAFGGKEGHLQRLRNEGVTITNDKVDLHRYLWLPDTFKR